MKRLSRWGLILASLFVVFAGFCIVRTELCFRDDGMFCAIGYFIPGFPWSLLIRGIPDSVFRWLGPKLSNVVFYIVPALSAMVNLYLSYWYGRLLEEGRRRRIQ